MIIVGRVAVATPEISSFVSRLLVKLEFVTESLAGSKLALNILFAFAFSVASYLPERPDARRPAKTPASQAD